MDTQQIVIIIWYYIGIKICILACTLQLNNITQTRIELNNNKFVQ